MNNEARELSRLMKVLSVETRVRIIALLRESTLCVNALAARLGLTPGAVSQHLRVMREARLVVDEKRGYFVHYRLDETVLSAWRERVSALMGPSDGTRNAGKGGRLCAAAAGKRKKGRKSAGNRKN